MALFVEVARRKSFSQAAAALDVPISSLSRRITQFEAAIGLRLLDRTTRKLVLTPHGEAYYERATQVVEEAQRSFDEMIAQARGPSGPLRLSAPVEDWVLRVLPAVVAEFARAHPHVTVHVELRASGAEPAENIDVAILAEEPREAATAARRIGSLATGLFASHGYLARAGTPRHPDDLAAHDLLAAKPGGAIVLDRDGETATVTARGTISSSSPPLARCLAASGEGIALLPVMDAEGSELCRVLPEWSGPAVPVVVAARSRLMPAKVRAFIEVGGGRLAGLLGAEAADADPPLLHACRA